jgi:hypothetical protein
MEREEYLPGNAPGLPSIPQGLVDVHLIGLFFIFILPPFCLRFPHRRLLLLLLLPLSPFLRLSAFSLLMSPPGSLHGSGSGSDVFSRKV